MSKKARQYIGLLIAVVLYYVIHEGAHLVVALALGVFKQINIIGLGVQIDVMSEQMTSQEQTAGALDSPAKTSVLQESSLDSQDIVAVCFSQLQSLLETRKKKIDPSTFSLRTLKTYLVLIEGLTLPSFSLSWTKLGTIVNGRSNEGRFYQ